ncbi:MAG: hypothetical protein ABFR75_11035 [Acidobacteriota bacterium]
MKKSVIFILIFNFVFIAFGSKAVLMPGLNKPIYMIVDNGQIFIADFPHMYIYSAEDFKLKKKFGKKGEGPQEFMGYILFEVTPDRLVLDSQGKHSYYTRKGEFIKEVPFKTGGRYKVLGKNYAAYGYYQEDRIFFMAVNVVDHNFKKIKEVYRYPDWYQEQGPKKGIHVIDYFRTRCLTSGNRLVVRDMKDFKFYIYNENGEKVADISRDYEKLKVTERDKENYHNYIKIHPNFKQFYENQKGNIKFYKYFPPVRDFLLVKDRMYIFTYLKKEGKTEFFIYDLNGKFLKRTFIELNHIDMIDCGPTWVDKGYLYQLAENEDEEEWELRITEIK